MCPGRGVREGVERWQVVKAAARRNDAEAVKMVSGFVFRDFSCEQPRLAAVSRWHIVAVADQLLKGKA